MKKIAVLIILLSSCLSYSLGQSYNSQKIALSNFLTRMYNNAPFEGVRIVDDYDSHYLISVLSLEKSKYPNESTLYRISEVKAMSQASRFLNGSEITSEFIVTTTEDANGKSHTQVIEYLIENSVGFVKQLELLTSFTSKDDNYTVFIYAKEVPATNLRKTNKRGKNK